MPLPILVLWIAKEKIYAIRISRLFSFLRTLLREEYRGHGCQHLVVVYEPRDVLVFPRKQGGLVHFSPLSGLYTTGTEIQQTRCDSVIAEFI
jgi:hypothetical protein